MDSLRIALFTLSGIFVLVAGWHRIQSQRSGEPLDRTKEGWPLLIGIRLTALLTLILTSMWLYNPAWFPGAGLPVPERARWLGVTGFACATAWLIWMFRTLGRNLTDTVVTRRDATFVDSGPYQFVRNPMYTGVLVLCLSLALGLGTWLPSVGGILVFTLLAVRTGIEERYLIEKFGDQYREYMSRVGRFFPNVRHS